MEEIKTYYVLTVYNLADTTFGDGTTNVFFSYEENGACQETPNLEYAKKFEKIGEAMKTAADLNSKYSGYFYKVKPYYIN